MPEETLNIDYHTKLLVLKALNSTRSFSAAARKLGIARRALEKLIKDYNITQQWIIKEPVQSQSKRPLHSVA